MKFSPLFVEFCVTVPFVVPPPCGTVKRADGALVDLVTFAGALFSVLAGVALDSVMDDVVGVSTAGGVAMVLTFSVKVLVGVFAIVVVAVVVEAEVVVCFSVVVVCFCVVVILEAVGVMVGGAFGAVSFSAVVVSPFLVGVVGEASTNISIVSVDNNISSYMYGERRVDFR